jgi:hypothetical protein
MKCNITKTKLTADIDAFVTTIPASTSGFPTSGSLEIGGTEVVSYTGVTATSFTGVTRAAPGALPHLKDVDIKISGVADNGDNASCTTLTGTALGDYNFASGTGLLSTYRYAFNLLTGPFNDSNADSTVSTGDLYLTNWSYRDELYGAGKFSFPVGMPIYTDIGTSALYSVTSTSPVDNALTALPYFLEIGPTSGLTTSQLHEDGLIVNAASVSSSANQYGAFAQGGSYLSGNLSGRYSSELIPDTSSRTDVGFRCYIPIVNGNYPSDSPLHPYSY